MSWMAMRVEQDQLARLIESTKVDAASGDRSLELEDTPASMDLPPAPSGTSKASKLRAGFLQMEANYSRGSPVKELVDKVEQFRRRMSVYLKPSFKLPTDVTSIEAALTDLQEIDRLAKDLDEAGMTQPNLD